METLETSCPEGGRLWILDGEMEVAVAHNVFFFPAKSYFLLLQRLALPLFFLSPDTGRTLVPPRVSVPPRRGQPLSCSGGNSFEKGTPLLHPRTEMHGFSLGLRLTQPDRDGMGVT